MKIWFWIVLVFALVALASWYLTYTAARLDRLHTRVEGSVSALDAQLVRRAEAILEVARAGWLDPASSMLLIEAATNALEAADSTQVHDEVREESFAAHRARVESELTEVARAVFPPEVVAAVVEQPGGEDALRRVEQANRRVALARAFHDEAVDAVRLVRSKPAVRIFHLAGRTELPGLTQFDADLPELADQA